MAINGWTCTAHYQHMMTTEERQTIQFISRCTELYL